MKDFDNSTRVFLELVRAGLWGNGNLDIRIDGTKDWQEIYQLATEQSVLGLVLAGLEHSDVKPPQSLLLQWIGEVQIIEQRNKEMNVFIADMIEELRKNDIYTLLVKGQGIAQSYEKPLWRSCGDVDFYLSEDNYKKAKELLLPLATSVEPEGKYQKHLNMTMDSWVVELHGSMRSGLSKRMDKVIDEIHQDIFYGGNVRSWKDGSTLVFLPSSGNDVLIVFTHFLKHFFKGGIGLRQICDWCRLLYRYSSELDLRLLESRINRSGLMTEWKAFGAFAVEYLDMPVEAMPFYSADGRWKNKAKKIMYLTLDSDDIERRDKSYFGKYPYVIRKLISFSRRCGDLLRVARVFPMDSLRFFPSIVFRGLKSAARGE